MNGWFAKAREKEPELGEEYIDKPEPYTLSDDPDDYFPCLMVLAGSGNPFLKVSIEEEYTITEFSTTSPL